MVWARRAEQDGSLRPRGPCSLRHWPPVWRSPCRQGPGARGRAATRSLLPVQRSQCAEACSTAGEEPSAWPVRRRLERADASLPAGHGAAFHRSQPSFGIPAKLRAFETPGPKNRAKPKSSLATRRVVRGAGRIPTAAGYHIPQPLRHMTGRTAQRRGGGDRQNGPPVVWAPLRVSLGSSPGPAACNLPPA